MSGGRGKNINVYIFLSTLVAHIPSILNCIYLLFAIITYISLFITYARSRRKFLRKNSTSSFSVVKVFMKSKFVVPVTVISTYILLAAGPGVAKTVISTSIGMFSSGWEYFFIYYSISTRISHTIDALLYIFLQKKVRNLLYKNLAIHFNRNSTRTLFSSIWVLQQRISRKGKQHHKDNELDEVEIDDVEYGERELQFEVRILVPIVSSGNRNGVSSGRNAMEVENTMSPIVVH